MSTENIQLSSLPGGKDNSARSDPVQQASFEDVEGGEGFSLPPADGGKDAYLFLFTCFMLEALVWGFPASYGIFQEYYTTHEPFRGSSNIAVIGTCAMVGYQLP